MPGELVPTGKAKSIPTPNEGTRFVQSHSLPVGIIVPPPDIRAIAEKTAQFVAKNGADFEKKILLNEQKNPKFRFLTPSDPYHAFYQHKLTEHREKPAGKPESATEKTATVVPAQVQPPKKVLEEPREEMYTIRIPEGMGALELDVIKLAAQYAARNGKSFLQGLAHREQSNMLFSFLKNTHSLHPIFLKLKDAYSLVLNPGSGVKESLEQDVEDKDKVLDRILKRLEWNVERKRESKIEHEEAEKERIAMAEIDWLDFAVVANLEFEEEEDDELPPPSTLDDVLQSQKAVLKLEGSLAQEKLKDEEEQRMIDEAVAAQSVSKPPEPGMKIVKDYKPPAALGPKMTKGASALNYVVSPITGEMIPINEMADHMRYSLIDPKYKEQRQSMLAKIKGSIQATDEEISRNIVLLAGTRPDIFSTEDTEISDAIQKQMETGGASKNKEPAALGPRPQVGPTAPPPFVGRLPAHPPPPPPAPSSNLPPEPPSIPPPTRRPHEPEPHSAPEAATVEQPQGPLDSAPTSERAKGDSRKRSVEALEEASGRAKRTKIEKEDLVPKNDFLAAHPGAHTLYIEVDKVDDQEGFDGQSLRVQVDSLSVLVSSLKRKIAAQVSISPNRQKLEVEGLGTLRDNVSLAYYNVSEDLTVSLVPKNQ